MCLMDMHGQVSDDIYPHIDREIAEGVAQENGGVLKIIFELSQKPWAL